MDEKERRKKSDPLKYAFMHPKQKEATASLKPIRVLFWGNRVGKTEWGAQEVARYALNKHPHKDVGEPVEIWCACPSYDLQKDTTQPKLLRYIPKGAVKKIDYLRGDIIKEMRLTNGSIITFKSYEQGREKFQGAGKRLIWFDEEPPEDIWDECFVRIEAGIQLDYIMTMTPIKGMTWVYSRIYLDTGNPDLFVSEAGWDDNPLLTEDQKRQISRGLSKEAIKVRRDGKFVKRVGLVCSWWNRAKHIRHYETLDRSWTWYEMLDGGFGDPACYLLIGVDPANNVHVVDGFRERELLTAQIKERRKVKIGSLRVNQGWTDNDNPRLQAELAEAPNSMSLVPVVKDKGDKASWDEALAEKLGEYGRIQPGTGEPRLFFSDDLVRVNEKSGNEENWAMQEVENLTWLERTSKQGEEIIPQWDDHRRFGHHFDFTRALAYFLISYMKPTEEEDEDQSTGNAAAMWGRR